MHIDVLEHRKLFAATSTLTDGVVRVIGTDESETIEVRQEVSFRDADAAITRLATTLKVLVNGVEIGSYAEADVKRVNIFAGGGNDRVIGVASSLFTVGRLVVGETSDTDEVTVVGTGASLRMYVEGGSGNDRITGGSGNDALYGGRGNDRIVDGFGRNLVDGGAGDDVINTVDENASTRTIRLRDVHAQTGGGFAWTTDDSRVPYDSIRRYGATTPDTVIGGDGNDSATVNQDDIVTEVENVTRSVRFSPAGEFYLAENGKVGSIIVSEQGTAMITSDGKTVTYNGKQYDISDIDRDGDGAIRLDDLIRAAERRSSRGA